MFLTTAHPLAVIVTQSQPEIEYSLPELQAPRSSVADKPWPSANTHTQRPHAGEGSLQLLQAQNTQHTPVNAEQTLLQVHA